jgi:drug/metabolite transporter (DMT)-like permease
MALASTLIDVVISSPIFVYFLIKGEGINFDLGIAVLAVISAGSYGISLGMQYAALKRVDMSVMGIVLRLNILVATLIGVIFFGEVLNNWNILGLIAILIANITILMDGKKLNMSIGILFTIIAAIASAVATTMDKFILNSVNSFLYVFINCLLTAIVLFLMKPSVIKESLFQIKNRFSIFLIMSITTVGAWVISSYVLQNMDVSTFVPVQKTITLIIPVIFGIIIFSERKNLSRKIFGLVLAIIGIGLMYL